MRNYMEFLRRPWLLSSILVVLSVSWAIQVAMSKPTPIMRGMDMSEHTLSSKESESDSLPIQMNRHSSLSFEIHYPVCPPCDLSQNIPPEPQNPQRPRKMSRAPPSPPEVSQKVELAAELLEEEHQPPPPDVSKEKELAKEENMKDSIKKGLKIAGYVVSLASLGQPFYMFWGTGNFIHTTKLYNEMNTACTALSSYGWLLYGIVQVSYTDSEQIIGIDAIAVNAMNWAVTTFLFLILLLRVREDKGKVCIFVLGGYVILTVFALQFPIIKWVKKESLTKLITGIIAGVLQGISEIIPIRALMWWVDPPAQAYEDIRHYKKFIILSRAIDCIVTSYWMLYCVFTYQFDAFGIGNIACASLSLVSFVLHSAWAVKPN